MKKIARIRDFSKGGLNTDMPPHDLPNSNITDGINFRCENNSIINFGGHLDYASTSNNNTKYITHVRNEGVSYFIGCGQKLIAYDGEQQGIIGDFNVLYPEQWSSAIMGSIVVFNHPEVGPYYWVPNSVKTEVIPLPWDVATGDTWQDKAQSASIIRAHKSIMIAMDLDSSSGHLPHGVRWSDPADNNDIPYTWDETDPTNRAGLNVLHDSGGAIRDGLSLRDNFIIYREGAIWRMDYTGGSWVWNFRKQAFNIGALARDCVTEVNGSHFVFGDGDIVIFDGNSVNSIVNDRIRRRINSSISTDHFLNSYVVQHREKKEVWACFPENGHEYPNLAYIWNWENNTWSLRELDDITHIAFGGINAIQDEDDGTWDEGENTNWDNDELPWNSKPYIPFANTLIGAQLNGDFKQLDPRLNKSSNVVNTFFERTDLAIDSQQVVTSIDRVYPNVEGGGLLSIEVGSQQMAGGPVTWKPMQNFNVGFDRKIDIRTTGELHAIRVSANTSSAFRFSGIDIEYTPAGRR